MRKDPTKFRERFARWKNGELVYKAGLPHYEDGKDARTLEYHPEEDYYYGGNLFGKGNELVVKGSAPTKLYMHPWKTERDLLREQNEYYYSLPRKEGWKRDLERPLSPVDPVGEFVVVGTALNPVFKAAGSYLFGGIGELIKDATYKAVGKIKPLRGALVAKEMNNAIKSVGPFSEDVYGRQIYVSPANFDKPSSSIGFFDAKNKARLVDGDGNVNMRAAVNIVKDIYKTFPAARSYKKIMNSSGNLYDHTKAVVKSALEMELPAGVSRQELVESALIHDFGKILDNSVHHDMATEQIIKELGLVDAGLINKSAVDAAAIHMDPGIAARSNLARGLHFADVARGQNIYKVLDENPHLAYLTGKPLVNPQLPRDTEWLLKNIINPLIDKYGYKLSQEERAMLGLPKYVEGDPLIPFNINDETARKAVLHILKRHRTFERTSHYPSSTFELLLKEQAARNTGKNIEDVTTDDLFDTSSLFIKNTNTDSGTMGLLQYLNSAQLSPSEYQALYTSTRDITALNYARLGSDKPSRMDLVQMNINNNPNWSLAELWANNEFPVVSSTGNLAKDMKVSDFRKYELPYIFNTGKQDFLQRLAEIGKKYYRQSYIEAPDMPNYARPITYEPGKGGIQLQKTGRNPNPEISAKRVLNVELDVNEILENFGLSKVFPKILKNEHGEEKVVSFTRYNELYRNLDSVERIALSLQQKPIAEWESFQIRNMFDVLYLNKLITNRQYCAAVRDLDKQFIKKQSENYNPLRYVGGPKQWMARAKSIYFKAIRADNSKNAFFKRQEALKIVKTKAAKELFEDQGITPNYSLESPDGYRVFTTEPDGFRGGPDANYKGGSHYVIVGKRGSKQLNIVGKYEPTEEEINAARSNFGGSHGGRLSGLMSKLSRNFGGFFIPILGSWYLNTEKTTE